MVGEVEEGERSCAEESRMGWTALAMAVGFSPSTRVVRLLGGRRDASKLNPSARTTEVALENGDGDDSGALGGTSVGAESREAGGW
jgi:hypothetical protein